MGAYLHIEKGPSPSVAFRLSRRKRRGKSGVTAGLQLRYRSSSIEEFSVLIPKRNVSMRSYLVLSLC